MGLETSDDIYFYQREELAGLLKSLANRHEPLMINGEVALFADEIYRVLEKINQKHHFSRKERHALTEAGFNLEQIHPGL